MNHYSRTGWLHGNISHARATACILFAMPRSLAPSAHSRFSIDALYCSMQIACLAYTFASVGQRLRISLQRCSSERTSFRAHPLPSCWLAARQTARSPVMAAAPVLAHPLAPCLQCLAAQRHRPIVASVSTLSPDANYVPPRLHLCFCWQSSAIRDALEWPLVCAAANACGLAPSTLLSRPAFELTHRHHTGWLHGNLLPLPFTVTAPVLDHSPTCTVLAMSRSPVSSCMCFGVPHRLL